MISAPLALVLFLAILWFGCALSREDEAALSRPEYDPYRLDRWLAGERKIS